MIILDEEDPIQTILTSNSNVDNDKWLSELYSTFTKHSRSSLFTNEEKENMEDVLESLATFSSHKNDTESDYDE